MTTYKPLVIRMLKRLQFTIQFVQIKKNSFYLVKTKISLILS